jgi:hypothetical protein
MQPHGNSGAKEAQIEILHRPISDFQPTFQNPFHLSPPFAVVFSVLHHQSQREKIFASTRS